MSDLTQDQRYKPLVGMNQALNAWSIDNSNAKPKEILNNTKQFIFLLWRYCY